MDAMAARNICMAPWCNVQQCEKDVKEKSKEESLKAMEEGDQDEEAVTHPKTLALRARKAALEARLQEMKAVQEATPKPIPR